MTAIRSLPVLEHVAGMGAAGFQEVLDSRSFVDVHHLDVPGGEALPSALGDVAGLLVLGGAVSVTDRAAHPWLPAELDLLRAAVDAEVPVLGVGLGALLLGEALGGRVERREVPRAAYVPLSRTEAGRADPVMGGWPDGAPALQLHEDHVAELPPGAVAVLEGADGTAAWRLGSALALELHPEVTGDQLRALVEGDTLDALLARSDVDPDQLAIDGERRSRITVAYGRALVGRFLDGPVRQRAQA